ncbi:MAG: hypothetical protein ACRELV_08210 [Longimicrobiales bacterium]
MSRSGIGVGLVCALVWAGALEAQVRLPDPVNSPEVRPDTGVSGVSRWAAGGGVFGGILPTPPAGSCAQAMLPSTALDASMILRLRGAWSLESHGRVVMPLDYTACLTGDAARSDGTYRRHAGARTAEDGAFGYVDLRVRYQPVGWDGIVLSAGPGLVTSGDVPFLVAALGKRFAAGLAIDAEVLTFRVPYAIREEVWRDGALQSSMIVERGHEFRPGIGLRIAIERPLPGILR